MNGKFLSLLCSKMSIFFQWSSLSRVDRFYWCYVWRFLSLLRNNNVNYNNNYLYIILYMKYFLILLLFAKPYYYYYYSIRYCGRIYFSNILYRQSVAFMRFTRFQEDFESQAHHRRRGYPLFVKTKQDVFLSDVPLTCQPSTTWRHMDFVEIVSRISSRWRRNWERI